MSVTLRTNIGRPLVYRDSTRADAQGRYRFSLPYASGKNGALAAGPIRISAASGAVEISVPEEAVVEGREVAVPALESAKAR